MTEPEFMILWGSSSYRDSRSVVEVVRRTKTQIIVRDGDRERRFTASSGREVGADRWSMVWISVATPEELTKVREEMRRRALIARIKPTVWNTLTTAQLEAVVATLFPAGGT